MARSLLARAVSAAARLPGVLSGVLSGARAAWHRRAGQFPEQPLNGSTDGVCAQTGGINNVRGQALFMIDKHMKKRRLDAGAPR